MSSAFCPYYEACGGCTLQHLPPDDYTAFKHALLVRAVEALGLDSALAAPLVPVGQRSRRRAEFKVAVRKSEVSLGFMATRSHDLVAIDDCPVTVEAITALIPSLRTLIASLKKPGNIAAVHLTAVDRGVDICLICRASLTAADRQRLVDHCTSDAGASILRLMVKVADDDPVLLHTASPVCITLGGVAVELPPQSFLQATQEGQDAITRRVLEETHDAQKIVDLYCGCGTYSLPLAMQSKQVSAYEGSDAMVMALQNAARRSGLEERLEAAVRDLVKQPVDATSLRRFEAAIINPPRNGASPQVAQLAQSGIRTIVMVSCNPSTFERDARLLLQAGYRLTSATPIDQFYMTRHLELVAVFERSHL